MSTFRPTISVIIPAYNAEEHIHIPLESLSEQSYKDFEIIVVNDGSTDKTSEIISSFTESLPTITLINQQNNGVSNARNNGLRQAKGEYVIFIDGDDKVEKNFLEALLQRLEETGGNAAYCGFYKWGDSACRKEPECFSEENILKKRLMRKISFHVGCLMIRRDFLLSEKIFFNESLSLGEDLLFIYTLLCKTKVFSVNKYLYHHLYRNNSVMNKTWTQKDYQKNIETMDVICKTVGEICIDTDKDEILSLLEIEKFSAQLSYLWKLMLHRHYKLAKTLISDGYLEITKANLNKIKEKKKVKKYMILKSENTFMWAAVSYISIKKKRFTHVS